jgi:hypothetical protein
MLDIRRNLAFRRLASDLKAHSGKQERARKLDGDATYGQSGVTYG